jgi:hypothetical protein
MKFSELLGNKFVRIVLLIFFFLFIYKILFAIGIFFAIDANILSMYLCWIGMVMLFAALLQNENTNFNVKSKDEAATGAVAILGQLKDALKIATGNKTPDTDVASGKEKATGTEVATSKEKATGTSTEVLKPNPSPAGGPTGR